MNQCMPRSTYHYLPYTDTKDIGAADFYFAINATYRFILNNFGMKGLREYWQDLADEYYKPVSELWKNQGPSAMEKYWQEFFAAEPHAEVAVSRQENTVTVDIKVCPAISHLKKHEREIVPCFCEQCYYLGKRIAKNAGYDMVMAGGNGTCCQKFFKAGGK